MSPSSSEIYRLCIPLINNRKSRVLGFTKKYKILVKISLWEYLILPVGTEVKRSRRDFSITNHSTGQRKKSFPNVFRTGYSVTLSDNPNLRFCLRTSHLEGYSSKMSRWTSNRPWKEKLQLTRCSSMLWLSTTACLYVRFPGCQEAANLRAFLHQTNQDRKFLQKKITKFSF